MSEYRNDSHTPARVIWLSSLDSYADEISIDADDWQLIDHSLPYQASKRQLDLVVGYLERRTRENLLADGKGLPAVSIRNVLSQPGCVSTNIQSTIIGFWLVQLMQLSFIMVRLF